MHGAGSIQAPISISCGMFTMANSGGTLAQINYTIRTLLMVGVVGALGFGGYHGYVAYMAPQRELADAQQELDSAKEHLEAARSTLAERDAKIADLQSEVGAVTLELEAAERAKDRLETNNRLLKLRRRLARIEVLDQQVDDASQVQTKIRFFEIGESGQSLGEPVELMIEGDRVYVEYLVVKFDDKYIEEADLERGTAICLLERIFGEKQEPEKGFVIDRVGTRPTSYERGTPMSDFEEKIWRDFWTISNDRERAQQLGIRASHAQAPSIRVEAGGVYELDLRATGDFSLQRIDQAQPRDTPQQ